MTMEGIHFVGSFSRTYSVVTLGWQQIFMSWEKYRGLKQRNTIDSNKREIFLRYLLLNVKQEHDARQEMCI